MTQRDTEFVGNGLTIFPSVAVEKSSNSISFSKTG
jgi:hypothetical protein